MNRSFVTAVSAAALAAFLSPAEAQYQTPDPYPTYQSYQTDAQRAAYEAGYRGGYRTGYRDGTDRARFDDTRFRSYPGSYAGPYFDPNDPRYASWRQRYSQVYSYNDDLFYQQCRNSPDPAGVLAGAIIGGLIGNQAFRNEQAAATAAGIVIGGVIGANLMRHTNCEDRSYAYRTYYDVFNYGQPGRQIEWRNPRTGRYGSVIVDRYYVDPAGFRCANFRQTTYVAGGKYKESGIACQQPDRTWVLVG